MVPMTPLPPTRPRPPPKLTSLSATVDGALDYVPIEDAAGRDDGEHAVALAPVPELRPRLFWPLRARPFSRKWVRPVCAAQTQQTSVRADFPCPGCPGCSADSFPPRLDPPRLEACNLSGHPSMLSRLTTADSSRKISWCLRQKTLHRLGLGGHGGAADDRHDGLLCSALLCPAGVG